MTTPDTWRPDPQTEEQRKFDRFTHAVTVISEPHRLGHDGFVFHYDQKSTGVLDEGVEERLLVVPANVYPHLHRIKLTVGAGDCDYELYEGTTVSANGSAQTVFTTNRNSTNTADMGVYDGPTITDDGTLLHSAWAPPTATGNGQSLTGVSGADLGEEWVLKPSTNYLLRVTNNSGSTISIGTELLWYEVGYDE